MRTTMRRGVVAAWAAALLWPATGWAEKTVEAAPPTRFSTTDITMDQGERLTFRNGDTVSHDVTARDLGPNGKPLFKSELTPSGKTSVVEGAQYLPEGQYAFYCSVHPSMKGTLRVTANGTPAQRPGAGGPGQSPTADRVRPRMTLRLVSRTTRTARARHALVVKFTVSEPSRVDLTAVARPRPGGPLVVIARRTLRRASGSQRVRLALTKAGRAALRRRGSLAVVVRGRAVDRAGNRGRVAVHGRTLTP